MKKLIVCILCCFLFADVSYATVSVIGGLTRERDVVPGEACEGIILVKNNEDVPAQIKISQADYSFSADGKTHYSEAGVHTRSNANWMSITPSRITIPPKEIASVYYQINVPKKPGATGTYWSVVIIEPVPSDGPPEVRRQQGKHAVGVQTIIRYAVQVVTNIGSSGSRDVRFLDKKIIRGNDDTILQMDIENIGERSLSPFVWAELYTTEGQCIGRFQSDRMRIFPECSVRYRIALTEVPKGLYKALVILDHGDENVFGADYDLHIQ